MLEICIISFEGITIFWERNKCIFAGDQKEILPDSWFIWKTYMFYWKIKPKPDTSCFVQNAALVAQPPGRWMKLHTPCCCFILFYSPFATVLHLVSKVKKSASWVQILSSLDKKRKKCDLGTIWQKDEYNGTNKILSWEVGSIELMFKICDSLSHGQSWS